ncbi:MAG: flagellar assembly protein FliW [Actinomycetota bacterium]|nr:flagellar assembly protein FliW [Actinomycetota bacterium]
MTAAALEDEAPTLELVEPMPGFPGARHFHLVELAAGGTLYALRSVEDPALRFLVVPPTFFFPDYAPEIDDADAARLGLDSADDAVVLLVVTPGDTPADATANLLAPVVVNTATRRAAQVVLADSSLPLRAPLRR